MARPTLIKIGTLNVKSVETNSLYVQELRNTCDIVFLQETWLFNFQTPLFNQYFTTHCSMGKAVDDDDPLPPTQKPRGYGGAACLIRKSIQTKYKFLPNGGNRITAIEVQSNPPLCVVGVYMPVRGTSGKTDFIEILDEIHDILMNFGNSHAVFIVGDMNSSLTLRSGNERDKILSENGLHHFQNGELCIYILIIQASLKLTISSAMLKEKNWL